MREIINIIIILDQSMHCQNDHFKFNLGQNVDVKDTKNKWVNGQIIYIKGSQVYVHYSGSSNKYDQFIDVKSDRILSQWEPGKQIYINNRIDAFHPYTSWIEARVADLEYEPNSQQVKRVKIHYFNYHPKYDRWVDFNDTNSIAMIGSRSKAYGIGKTRLKNKSQNLSLNELVKKILETKVRKMVQQLQRDDYVVKDIAGDGNCLFRSISDQLYGSSCLTQGTEDHHRPIRLLCLKYILDEKAFFQDYTTEDIQSYVKRKSQDGVWGDDIEIEALSQIYGRPIEIYSTCSKPIRTFHEDNQHQIEPLRLAYVGSCHYNSIKKRNKVGRGLLESPFGDYQTIFAVTYQQKGNNYCNDIIRFREIFSNSNGIDYALTENVEASEKKQENFSQNLLDFDHKQINKALQLSENQNILQQIQKSQLNQIQSLIEKEQIQHQLKSIEQRELQIAKELSKKAKKEQMDERPYWFQDLLNQGFRQNEINFAIEINGYDPDRVQNFLLDNM